MSNLIHFRPTNKTLNVRCLNGSAHTMDTYDINHVTCELCKDANTNKEFWDRLNVFKKPFKLLSY